MAFGEACRECYVLKNEESSVKVLDCIRRNASLLPYDDVYTYVHQDNLSFQPQVRKLNEKYNSINNKILNRHLIQGISEITTYFEQWGVGDDEFTIFEQIGSGLLDIINKSKNF